MSSFPHRDGGPAGDVPRTSPGWLSLLLGCLFLLTGCAIDPEHFAGFNPVPGAARKDVAYSELRALRGAAADGAERSAAGQDSLSWQACPPVEGIPSGLQCGRLVVAGPAGSARPGVTLTVVRRPAADPAARQGVALVAAQGPAGEPLLFAPAQDPLFRNLNRTFDLVTTQARTVGDLDAVRAALGEGTWSLIGSGPAVDLVADYARTHPEHTRATVLDGPDGTTQTTLAAGPAAAQIRVAARACSAGPAGPGRAEPGLMAVGNGACAPPPVLVAAPAADPASAGAVHEATGNDAWGDILLTVARHPDGQAGLRAGPCADAAIESFLQTLVLPVDGQCA